MQVETNLGADVIMQFDHVIPGQSAHAASRDASERSLRWLARCRAEFDRLHAMDGAPRQTLFPIVQGGIHADLRREAATHIAGAGSWDGFAIGGLSVGEEKPAMYEMLEVCDDAIPRHRPRYLMGVGNLGNAQLRLGGKAIQQSSNLCLQSLIHGIGQNNGSRGTAPRLGLPRRHG